MMVVRSLQIAILSLFLAATQNCLADSSVRYLSFAVGRHSILDHDIEDPGVLKIEYRFRPRWKWLLTPAVGAARSQDGASFVFADLKKDFFPGDHWVITPSFGLGSFTNGEDVKLGDSLEFRSGIEFAYQFKNDWRLGIQLFHLSNSGIGDTNPGIEVMFVSLSLPL